MSKEDYFQHLYMGWGRARKLEQLLLRNFPTASQSDLDWSIFEHGAPAYLGEFMQALEGRARVTLPRMLQRQRSLGLPAWEHINPCATDPNRSDRFQ